MPVQTLSPSTPQPLIDDEELTALAADEFAERFVDAATAIAALELAAKSAADIRALSAAEAPTSAAAAAIDAMAADLAADALDEAVTLMFAYRASSPSAAISNAAPNASRPMELHDWFERLRRKAKRGVGKEAKSALLRDLRSAGRKLLPQAIGLLAAAAPADVAPRRAFARIETTGRAMLRKGKRRLAELVRDELRQVMRDALIHVDAFVRARQRRQPDEAIAPIPDARDYFWGPSSEAAAPLAPANGDDSAVA